MAHQRIIVFIFVYSFPQQESWRRLPWSHWNGLWLAYKEDVIVAHYWGKGNVTEHIVFDSRKDKRMMSKGERLEKRDPGNKSDAVSLVPAWAVDIYVTWKEGMSNTAATVAKVQSSLALGSSIIFSQRTSWTINRRWASPLRLWRNTCQHHLETKNNVTSWWNCGLSLLGCVNRTDNFSPLSSVSLEYLNTIQEVDTSVRAIWLVEALITISKPI